MVGVLSVGQELSIVFKATKSGVHPSFIQQELANMAGVSLNLIGEDVIDGKECYIIKGSHNPPIGGVINNISLEFDKATLFLYRAQMSGEYHGFPFIQSSKHTYEFLTNHYYPLQVGKECRVIKTETRTTTMMGKTRTENKTINFTYKVEGIEEITVPAGTFKCFKIVQFDDTGKTLSTRWESDQIKQYEVKSIDHETNKIIELIPLG